MWLKKLLGGNAPREKHDPGEEPARVPPARQVQTGTHELKKSAEQQLKPKKGFDPYNSGAFKKADAWERVIRK